MLVVDDDDVLRSVLCRAMQKRGFNIATAGNVEQAIVIASQNKIDFALVDLKLPDASGLQLIERLRGLKPNLAIVMLTGYASVTTAVEAVKLGAVHYLAKPATVDDILKAFTLTCGNSEVEIQHQPASVNRVEWEHIQKVLHEHEGNISATARALNMHRRTLQRKLAKRPVKS
ncbi:response regulator transcription factor [Oleiphilus messinensis]|nr:response regulator transcription factor [Oleiphilus messinensis]